MARARARRPISGGARIGRSPAAGWLLVALAAICAAGLAGLGAWQLERRVWKLDLIDRVERRIHAEPVAMPGPDAWAGINDADHAYTRVSAGGRFLHDRETLVQAVTERGAGYWVLTPLRSAEGVTVLVNRGFVPPELRDPASRPAGNPPGEVRIAGLLRITEPDGGFLRANDPAAERWYSRDVAAIAAARQLGAAAPFFIDADATPNPGGWPVGGLMVVVFRNSHLVYALTWFALAFMLAGTAVFVAREEWRSRKDGLDSTVTRIPGAGHGGRHSLAAPDRRC